MLINRSMPRCTVIPELAYTDVGEAIKWLCTAFGFTLRLRIGNHRAQLNVGDGAIVLTSLDRADAADTPTAAGVAHAVMVRVDDARAHHARASQHSARMLGPPTDHPHGERQYSAIDIGGHRWTFSQSIADVNPTDWGGSPGEL